ncbi:MAG: hypothetical protein ACTSWQ_09130 [Candidatus Thorarchaeota archaeon]
MNVLVACEFSGIVRDAFLDLGHHAVSCDLLPTESTKRPDWIWGMNAFHWQTDIREVLSKTAYHYNWDLMIAHPPCQYIANSGVSWLYKQEGRWGLMKQGAEFFKLLLDAPIPRIAIENPIMHKYAVEIIGRRQDQCIQPWQFGHDESKRTCLWLKNLPALKPTNVVKRPKGEKYSNQTPSGQNKLGPSKDRWKIRSRTYEGIAKAMAEQWGSILTEGGE